MSGYQSYTIIETLHEPICDANTLYRLKKYSGEIMFYQINCHNCSIGLFIYQKDGNGPLLRCYDDRIREKFPAFGLTSKSEIQCNICLTIITRAENKYIKKTDTHFEERNSFEII